MVQVSIIIPIYNTEKYLHKCLDSIIAQTFADWECILVDDGSTDNSPQICDAYTQKDSRFYVIHKTNGGVSSARNAGLNHAKGKFIAFADSDDWVEETWLQEFIENIEGVDLVMQHSVWHNYPKYGETFYRKIPIEDYLSYEEKILKMYKVNILGYICTGIFRYDIIDKFSLRFNEEYHWREDWNFMLRYCQLIKTAKVLPARLYHYNYPQPNTREYTNFSLYHIRLICEEMIYIRNIVGEKLAKQLDLYTPILYETYRMYLTGNIYRKQRINVLTQWVYENQTQYGGNKVSLKILSWIIKHFSPQVADFLIQNFMKIHNRISRNRI